MKTDIKAAIAATALIALTLLGCTNSSKLAEGAADTEVEIDANAFDYDGHSYLIFYDGVASGIVHYPDCPCGK